MSESYQKGWRDGVADAKAGEWAFLMGLDDDYDRGYKDGHCTWRHNHGNGSQR